MKFFNLPGRVNGEASEGVDVDGGGADVVDAEGSNPLPKLSVDMAGVAEAVITTSFISQYKNYSKLLKYSSWQTLKSND